MFITLLFLVALFMPIGDPVPTPVVTTETMSGYAPHYAPKVMTRVSRVRKLPIVDCMVSSPYYKIGTWLTVKGLDTGVTLRCRVTDVSGPRDRARHIRTKRIVELDYRVTRAICGETNGSPKDCPVTVTK